MNVLTLESLRHPLLYKLIYIVLLVTGCAPVKYDGAFNRVKVTCCVLLVMGDQLSGIKDQGSGVGSIKVFLELNYIYTFFSVNLPEIYL